METRELEITTHYSSIIKEFGKNVIKDFRIVIPMSELVSARLFEREVYGRFQATKSSKTSEFQRTMD